MDWFIQQIEDHKIPIGGWSARFIDWLTDNFAWFFDAVADSIAKLDEAHYVAITTGAYDVFIWAGLESAESLGTFLRTKIGVIEGVQRTETFVNLAIKKRSDGSLFLK